jgi:hypothetical protein
MGSKWVNSGENRQISVEMADFTLTKRSGRLNVDIGAVLRTRVNTGDFCNRADAGDGCGGWTFGSMLTSF